MREQSAGEIIRKSYNTIDYRPIDHKNNKRRESMDYRSIDGETFPNDDSSPSQYRQRAIAERLLKILDEPKSWKFYLKCAYRLSEERIWALAELAMRPEVKLHNNYFVHLANKEMNK